MEQTSASARDYPADVGPELVILGLTLIIVAVFAVPWYRGRARRQRSKAAYEAERAQRATPVGGPSSGTPEPPSGEVVVLSYPGRTQADAAVAFQQDAQRMASHGYVPVSQSWAEGRPGVARVVAIGVFSTAIRPAGYLTVTYRKQEQQPKSDVGKVCPRCAETVKSAALVCRYCGHEFGSAA